MKVHCLFEQSGTFKKEFKKLGYQAYDYDILNDFNETDNIIDLFSEIQKAYAGEQSLFDTIKKEDLIIAFFPCVRFTRRMIFNFTRSGAGNKKFTDVDFELFGLSQEQVAIVRTAFALAKDASLREKALDDAAKTDRIVEAAKRSAAEGRKVTL